ncbi:type VII secretion-associated protein [Mycobacterium simiae]|uniref:Type VII secretion-associated protein n=1 Tax=Mycobacterium simiae TaxID=1784 RepID=A0A5B1BMD1_MYCSI|nr:type VII secretion-associated protein [Mycobacterium simiae]KAA1248364.1 type VII secretion-associated protein [Mycobacterium simiae]
MSGHRAVIAAGPSAIRRLCCGADSAVDDEACAAALGAIDDPVALVAGQPVAVGSLWSAALRTLAQGHHDGMIVVHPSWWSSSRIGVVSGAARAAAGGAFELLRRSWLLTRAAPEAGVVVEIADRLVVVVADDEVVAVPRLAEARHVAKEVAGVVAGSAPASGAVVIEVPSGVVEAPELALMIADALRAGQTVVSVVAVDDDRLARLARDLPPQPAANSVAEPRSRVGLMAGLAAAGVAMTVLVVAGIGHRGGRAAQVAPTTFLVEGRVALAVPVGWPTRRVVDGPGSARVQLTSPADREVALHVTQSPVPGETLAATAERLRRAIDAEPAGVFVDFNPAGSAAGRPAVTYREVRAAHHVWWTVLVDGTVRISVGCQSRPSAAEAVREVCERAVQSAHAVG